ncbi:PilW family protein [Vibrio vulnificus]|uniref:PilW family protein n=2 Tax=Vibrio vulnificus TaxID=672 RepID=UPI001F2AB9F0|nr:pilus assembly protein PilW [Vibrio vulnificus]MCU8459959.1 pilus assembly protein PilW [Vibrio vulnificus]
MNIMATLVAKQVSFQRKKQLGASLVEFMISATIGLFALGIVGSIFVQGQNTSVKRSKDLMLLQNTRSVTQMMHSDILRAGYDGGNGQTVRLSGATSVIYSHNSANEGLIAYAYFTKMSGATPLYKNVVYEQRNTDNHILRICEKELDHLITTAQANNFVGLVGNYCNSLFVASQIQVEAFNVVQKNIAGGSATSAYVDIELITHLTDLPSSKENVSFSVTQRNWQ